jgi:RNA polymerase sigma-70 factor (ECF subfamily)
MTGEIADSVAALHRSEWSRIVATLIRLVGDFDLAEDVAQEAFAAALVQWSAAGVPEYPRGWIIQTARHKAIDRLRRQSRFDAAAADIVSTRSTSVSQPDYDSAEIPDDRLRLIFTCCHPALALDAQVALTLRTLGGLETEEIARAFLVSTSTMAQRLVRAKRKIRDAGIPYLVPDTSDMPERLDAVMTVLYLIFTEGYAATKGDPIVRNDLCADAIELTRLVRMLMGERPHGEVTALLALMLLHHSRRDARLDDSGDLVLLDEQDRSRWHRMEISEALPLVEEALREAPGAYALQAAIAALHCQAERADQTDWPQIVRLYDLLERQHPSPVVSLNRAVAVAMVEGPHAALTVIDALAASGELAGYHLLHAARADLLVKAGRSLEAMESYRKALALATNESEKRFLANRLRRLGARETGRL